MHNTEKIREMLAKELDEYSTSGKLNVGAIDVIDKLAHAIKNLDKIIEKDGYSGARRYDAQNGYSMNYGGMYSRDNSQSGYSMNYSRDMQSIKQELREIMNGCDDRTKRKLQDIVEMM
jgi:hypothetical protein